MMPNIPQPYLAECDPDIQQLADDMLDLSIDFEEFDDVPEGEDDAQHEMQEAEAGGEADVPQAPEEMETEECRRDPADVSISPTFRIVGDNIDRKVLY